MPSGPAPAALWVLFRDRPVLDRGAVEASLGEGASVDGSDALLEVHLPDRSLRVVSIDAPLPQAVIDQCLPVAHLHPEQKERLASHRAHALVVLEGTAPPGVDGLVDLYRTAWALRGGDPGDGGASMLGVMNAVTWMCLTTEMLGQTMSPEFVAAVRASPAESLALWLGFVKLFKPDGSTWLVTRGGSLVGLPDLAWLAHDLEETDTVFAMFASVLDYAFTSGMRLAVGHTLDLSERPIQLRAPYEYVDYIGEGTLVLEPVP